MEAVLDNTERQIMDLLAAQRDGIMQSYRKACLDHKNVASFSFALDVTIKITGGGECDKIKSTCAVSFTAAPTVNQTI